MLDLPEFYISFLMMYFWLAYSLSGKKHNHVVILWWLIWLFSQGSSIWKYSVKTLWERIDKTRNITAFDVPLHFYILRADYDIVMIFLSITSTVPLENDREPSKPFFLTVP